MNKEMPNDIAAEQAVLGSMFMSKKACEKVIERLNPDAFYLDKHAKIFKAIASLKEAGSPIDITIVTNELEKRKELSSVGGVEYLSDIVMIVPSAANVDKMISTASSQVNDILNLQKRCAFELLDEKVREVAEYRLKYKEASLLELSEIISLETEHKITKSGVYHRMEKIKELASKIREKEDNLRKF